MRAGVAGVSRRRALPSAQTNVIVNGDFSQGTTGWNRFDYSGKSVTGGKAVFANSPAYDDINQPVTLTAGKYYELQYTVSGYVSGVVFSQISGGTARTATNRSANGTYTERLLINTGNNSFRIMLETSGSLSVDDVSFVGPYDTATVGGT